MAKDPRIDFEFGWLLDPLTEHPSFSCKKWFGGLAAYYEGKLVFVLMESPETEVWNGILVPVDRENQASLISSISELRPHSILGKWLYLPMKLENFENLSQKIIQLIRRGDARIGVWPQPKKSKKSKVKKSSKKSVKTKTQNHKKKKIK